MWIETLVHDTSTGELRWITCGNNQSENASWHDLIEEGWRFIGLSRDGNVLMTMNGYINEFRETGWKEDER